MKMIETSHLAIDPEILGGEPHIAGHRIGVSDVAIWLNYHHLSPSEIAERFHLTLGEVYAAMAYYYDHKEEIDRDILETDRQAAEIAERHSRMRGRESGAVPPEG